jgi:hypothetical protein
MTELTPIKELLSDPPRPRRRSARLNPDYAELTSGEELVLELVRVGVALRKARHLVDNHPESDIWQQLSWLPLRNPKRPASLLIAAIEHNYDAPVYAID